MQTSGNFRHPSLLPICRNLRSFALDLRLKIKYLRTPITQRAVFLLNRPKTKNDRDKIEAKRENHAWFQQIPVEYIALAQPDPVAIALTPAHSGGDAPALYTISYVLFYRDQI
jgi:hypothetical protein